MNFNHAPENQIETIAEVRVWQAVLLHTIEEWKSGPLRLQRQAEEYLFNDNIDFPEVCRRAGMDATRLRTQLSKLRTATIRPEHRAAA